MDHNNTKQYIIDELYKKGKYDEWVYLGSNFGFLSDLTKYPQYLYTDMNGYIVNVTMVSNEYDQTKNNVAVFNYNDRIMGPIVEQSKFRIVNNNEKLTTSGLFTCSGLSIIIGNKKFLTHIDATTNIDPMIIAIKYEIENQLLNPYTIDNINIFKGNGNTSYSFEKAKEICLKIGIQEHKINIKNVNMFYIVSV
jgi:hypothetical protein